MDIGKRFTRKRIIRGIKDLVPITYVRKLEVETEFYSISVENHQNYFVSKENVFVHNEPITLILGTLWGFVVTLDISIPIIGGLFYAIKHSCDNKHNFPSDKNIAYTTAAATGVNIFYKKMTNKEVREEAEKLKYRGLGDWDPDPSVKNQKDDKLPVFKHRKRNIWISPDCDQHKGSVWKQINKNGKRIASLDKDLNPLGD